MGIMNDCGILDADNKLVEGIWIRYLQDVKNKLKGENLKIFENVQCSPIPPPPPNPAAELLPLEDESKFPEFRKIWYPRYEEMAKGLNTAGGFNPAIPIADPTAVASAAGLTPPNLDLPAAVAGAVAIAAIQPPKDPIQILPIIAPELSPDELAAQGPTLAPKIAEGLAIPPPPPIPPIPDPRLQEYGYTEQFRFDTELAASPLKTFTAMFEKAADLPGIIAQLPSGPGALLSFVCTASEASQPKRMSTSSVEEAAAQVLKQHQVRLQGAQFLASNIGSGAITTAVVSGPLELTPLDAEEDIGYIEPVGPAVWSESLSGRRMRVLETLYNTIFDLGDESYKYTHCEYIPSVDGVATEDMYSYPVNPASDKYKGEDKKLKAKKGDKILVPIEGADVIQAGSGWLYANSDIATWSGPGTSCGLLPGAIFKSFGIYPGMYQFKLSKSTVWDSVESKYASTTGQIVSPLSVGPEAYKQLGILSKSWVFAWNEDDTPAGKRPKPGDIFVQTSADSGPFQPDPALEPDNKRYGNAVQHVGICVEFNINDNGKGGTMITADFGQKPTGNPAGEGGCYVKRDWYFNNKGRITFKTETTKKGPQQFNERFLYGWLDIELFPWHTYGL